MRVFSTVVTAVSHEARELVQEGILILFAEGAPPELAEVSVLHRVNQTPAPVAPAVGASIHIGGFSAEITAIGEYAWKKIGEIGHVVINFDAAASAMRPGEISATNLDRQALAKAIEPGVEIWFDA